MVSFELAEEERLIVETARDFIQREVVPFESVLIRRALDGSDSTPRLTCEELTALREKGRAAGLWGIETPEEYGGAALSPVLQALINVEIGRTFVNFSFGGSAQSILYQGNDAQREKYLIPVLEGTKIGRSTAISEPGMGSDVRGMRTMAVRDGSDFIINGEKMWISGGNEADFVVVFARTPGEGDPDGITGFIVDRDMGWTSTNIPLMGGRDTVAMLHFSDVRVPAENVLGEVNEGFKLLIDWVYDNRLLILAPRNVGAAEQMLSMAVDWASERATFGKKLRERENIAFWIAECDIDIRAAKLMVLNGAWKATVGKDYRHEAYVAKVHAARMANRVADKVLQIHGGMGYAVELGIERRYRDLRVERIYEGTDEMNIASIARNLFKRNLVPGQVF